MEPFDYLAKMPGKGIRSQLLEAFHYWIPTPKPALVVIARVVNLLHTSSLMIDDIEDDSDLRRGSPACHKVFGIPSTINSANYVYFEALRELMTLKDMRMITIFSGECVCAS
jgi:geranylgeranyl diphosphate synthase type 3